VSLPKTLRVLVLDDHPIHCMQARQLLQQAGFGPVDSALDARQALAMLWDFEWSNRQMMRNMYIRQQSYFSNSALAARELPDAAELKILEPLRGQIPDEVFTQVFEAPKTDGSGLIRDKQLQALELLEQAGWKAEGDKLVNAEGEPLSFTFLITQGSIERLLLPYKRNLAQIGISFQKDGSTGS